MKIGVVGCGAVGSFYGAKLCRAGHETHFLLRSDYEAVKARGVRVLSPEGDFTARPRAATAPERIGPCDLALIGLKTTANRRFAELLPPLVGPRTRILTLQNGVGNEEALARLFPPEQIFGGHCFVCLNRIAPGVVRHMAHGRIILGEFRRPPGPQAEELAATFRAAGVPCEVSPNLERAHWEKLVWNIPFNGLGVAGAAGYEQVLAGRLRPGQPLGECLSADRLLADPRWFALLRELMCEVIDAARALGHLIPYEFAEENIERTRCMGAYRASTLLDFERGLPLELEAMFLEPRRLAQAAGASTPRLDALCAILTELDRRGQEAPPPKSC